MLTKCAIAIVVAALSERFLSAPRHGRAEVAVAEKLTA
jgi:hypothetical protein